MIQIPDCISKTGKDRRGNNVLLGGIGVARADAWPLFCFISPNSIAVRVYYVTVVEDRPILSAKYRLLLLAKTDQPCSAVSPR